MIQQRTIAFRRRLQFFQELCKERHMELIDLCHLRNLLGIVSMMRSKDDAHRVTPISG